MKNREYNCIDREEGYKHFHTIWKYPRADILVSLLYDTWYLIRREYSTGNETTTVRLFQPFQKRYKNLRLEDENKN